VPARRHEAVNALFIMPVSRVRSTGVNMGTGLSEHEDREGSVLAQPRMSQAPLEASSHLDDLSSAVRDPARLAAANIMPATGLATDYLNAFNEPIMLFGLLADMPDMIEELHAWQPLTYEEHFARSGFQAKDLAIAAYKAAPDTIRLPFDTLSQQIAEAISAAVSDASALIGTGDQQRLSEFVAETTYGLQSMVMMLDGMVHGGHTGGAQDDIDALFD
jgi:hypothetical protein